MSESSDFSGLIERAVAGDGHALAEYAVAHFGTRMRRRIIAQLRGAGITTIDMGDILDSAGRRILVRFGTGGQKFVDRSAMEAYIAKSLINVAKEKIRAVRAERSRRPTLEQLLRDGARKPPDGANGSDENAIEFVLSRLKEDERRLAELRLSGMSNKQAAAAVSLPLLAFREKWRQVRRRMKVMLLAW